MGLRYAKTLIKFGIGIGLCIWLVTTVDLAALQNTMAKGSPLAYASALVCFGLSRMLEGVRLYLLVPERKLSPLATLRVVFISTFFNNFAATVIGDGYRTYEVQRVVRGWTQSITAVLLDRLLGLGCLVVLVTTCALLVAPVWQSTLNLNWTPGPDLITGAGIGLLALLLAAALLERRFQIRQKLQATARQSWRVVRQLSPSNFVATVGTSLVSQMLVALMVFILLRSFGESTGYLETLFAMLVVFLAAFIPVSIGSLGVREGLLVLLLPLFGTSMESALAAALVSRAMMYVYAIAGGVWMLMADITPQSWRTQEEAVHEA